MAIRITSLHYYPIKSCAGVSAASVTLNRFGFAFDRQWMVVRAEDGVFLSQREYAQMARIYPSIQADALTVAAAEMPELRINLEPESTVACREATVWKFSGWAEDEGDAAADWFSAALDTPCRLVRAGSEWMRPVGGRSAEQDAGQVGFADGYPVLLASESSLADLNSRLGLPVPMDRFRANIVIAGDELLPWAEDTWTQVRLGDLGLLFRIAKPCARCAITTIDQASGEARGPEPLKTLSQFRRNQDNKVLFAANLIHGPEGIGKAVSVGDRALPS